MDGDKPKKQRFKRYPIGFLHIDIAELRTAERKLYLFVAIDRTSKFAVAQLVEKAKRKMAWEFLELLLEAVPHRVHTILTDRAVGTPLVRETMARGIQFAEQPRNRNTIYPRQMRLDMICEANGIEHRLTKTPRKRRSVHQLPSPKRFPDLSAAGLCDIFRRLSE